MSLELAKIIVPSVLVVVGWVVVHFLQRAASSKQELRKELRADLDALRENVRDLRKTCIAYFVAGDEQADTPVVMRVLFDDLRRQSMDLAIVLLAPSDRERAYNALTHLGQNATGGPFETKNRKKLSPYDKQLQAIFSHGTTLVSCLEEGFTKKYPRN